LEKKKMSTHKRIPHHEKPLSEAMTNAVRQLNLLRIDNDDSVEELCKVCEVNPRTIPILEARGKDTPSELLLGKDIAVLSWRWDLMKHAETTLEESKIMRSPKIMRFLEKARLRNFKLVWVDWMCIPQHPEGDVKATIMQHIKASRVLYERCTVLLVDLEEIYPGISLPSVDYMTRLWTTAEMSAMLANPHTTFSTFCEVSKINHMTMQIALGPSWANATQSLENYIAEFEQFSQARSAERADLPPQMQYYQYQNGLMIYLYNIGYVQISKKYGTNVPTFLCSSVMKMDSLKDQTHMSTPPPISQDIQGKLIQEYIDKYQADGNKHPDILALMREIGKHTEMPPNFSHQKHYKAFLLLMYDVFDHQMKTKKWNSKCFEELLVSLGEHPTKPKSDILKFFMPGDDKVVRDMIFNEMGQVVTPLTIRGMELPRSPIGHELHVQLPVKGCKSIFDVLNKCEEIHTYIDGSESAANLVLISLSCVPGFRGKKYLSFDVTGFESRVTVSNSSGDVSVVVWSGGASNARGRETIDGYLKDVEIMLNTGIYQNGKNISVSMPAKATIKTLTELLHSLENTGSGLKTEAELVALIKKTGIQLREKS
jgi:hypothetical protein